MTTAHKAFLAEYYWRASSVFEFGVGESSTLLAAAAGVRRFTGVESDATWIARLGARVPVVGVVDPLLVPHRVHLNRVVAPVHPLVGQRLLQRWRLGRVCLLAILVHAHLHAKRHLRTRDLELICLEWHRPYPHIVGVGV